jgi:NADH-quinone oxidoreductase subunit J
LPASPESRNTGLSRRGKVPWSWLPGLPLRGIPEYLPLGSATMIVQAILFYIFAVVAVASGVLVVSARNPVHSVLFLILAFFNAAGMFILIGAEFLAMILVIVYVGAVAVLFLFVVMMLDIDFVQLRSGFVRYLPIGAVVGLILLAELVFVVSILGHAIAQQGVSGTVASATGGLPLTNTRALGDILYTRYLFGFQVAGLILLVAMIGAIVLTLRHRADVRRQSISAQLGRRRAETVEVVKVPLGAGSD